MAVSVVATSSPMLGEGGSDGAGGSVGGGEDSITEDGIGVGGGGGGITTGTIVGEMTASVGAVSTGIPRWVEAAAAVGRAVTSRSSNATDVMEAGTAMVAVMRTLAAATVIVTAEVSTPAIVAMAERNDDVSW